MSDPTSSDPVTSTVVNKSEDAVLGEVRFNNSSTQEAAGAGQSIVEDDDLALAKLLQEQERAFLALSGMNDGADPLAGSVWRRENVPPDSEANVSLDNAYRPILASSDQIGPENEPESDEALAWRMMQEEETAFRQRMMALAGIMPADAAEDDATMYGDAAVVRNADNDVDEANGNDVPDPDNMSYEQLTALGEIAGKVVVGLSDEQIAALHRMVYIDFVSFRRNKATKESTSDTSKERGDWDIDRRIVHGTETPEERGQAPKPSRDAAAENGTHTEREEGEQEQCVVCRIEYDEDDEIALLPCNHVYHPECIAQWLRQKKSCPHCGVEVVPTCD